MSKRRDNYRNANEKPLKDAIDDLLKAYRLDGDIKKQKFYSDWEEIVGTPIANRTESLNLKGKTLYIKMNSSVMREELLSIKSLFIKKINDFMGEEWVTNIYLD